MYSKIGYLGVSGESQLLGLAAHCCWEVSPASGPYASRSNAISRMIRHRCSKNKSARKYCTLNGRHGAWPIVVALQCAQSTGIGWFDSSGVPLMVVDCACVRLSDVQRVVAAPPPSPASFCTPCAQLQPKPLPLAPHTSCQMADDASADRGRRATGAAGGAAPLAQGPEAGATK